MHSLMRLKRRKIIRLKPQFACDKRGGESEKDISEDRATSPANKDLRNRVFIEYDPLAAGDDGYNNKKKEDRMDIFMRL